MNIGAVDIVGSARGHIRFGEKAVHFAAGHIFGHSADIVNGPDRIHDTVKIDPDHAGRAYRLQQRR